MSDELMLRALNAEYLNACVTADVAWFERHLSDTFVYRRSDGTVRDRSEFLRATAAGPDIIEYRLERLRLRVDGDTAAIDGTGSFIRPDGSRGTSRYTDVYRRIGGEWKVISAEVARS